jgi:hypothetical protein
LATKLGGLTGIAFCHRWLVGISGACDDALRIKIPERRQVFLILLHIPIGGISPSFGVVRLLTQLRAFESVACSRV